MVAVKNKQLHKTLVCEGYEGEKRTEHQQNSQDTEQAWIQTVSQEH